MTKGSLCWWSVATIRKGLMTWYTILLLLIAGTAGCGGGGSPEDGNVEVDLLEVDNVEDADDARDDGDTGETSSCPAGQTLCETECVNLRNDRGHCGDCDTACAPGEICTDGECEVSCTATLTNCDGVCRDLQTDPYHCGDCNTSCPDGEVCSRGVCAATCGTGLVDCGGSCVDLENDPSHCGACDSPCTSHDHSVPFCIGGTCGFVCDAGYGDCDGRADNGCEVPLNTIANCRGCGVVCNYANATALCTETGCTMGTCTPGFADCNRSTLDGCEIDTRTDRAHCGNCDTSCPDGEVCSGSICTVSCVSGMSLCGGTCVDTRYDPNNCGECDAVCSIDHGAAACLDGICVLASCDESWGNCNYTPTDGCESNLSSDRLHCGACGTSCDWSEDCRVSNCEHCITGRTGLLFDGVDDYVYIGDAPGLDITGPITFEAWVRNAAPFNDAPILAKENSGGRQQYWFGVFYGHFGILLGNGTGWGLSARSSGSILPDTWTHLASVWNGTTWYNYQDGMLVGTGSYSSGSLPVGDEPLTIGINSGYDFTRYSGYLSDVRLWSVARTEAQIRENMCELSDATGLVGRWLLNDGSGQTAADASGNGFDGRLGAVATPDPRDPTWSALPVP